MDALVLVLVATSLLPWALTRPAIGRPAGRPIAARWRRRSTHPGHVDPAVQLDLVRSALAAGASVPAALDALGDALGRDAGAQLRRVVAALRLGADWDEAWDLMGPPETTASTRSALQTSDSSRIRDCLAPAWRDGVDPDPLLRQAAATIRSGRSARAREAAARLGVRLVLPLGCCLLPAFVLLGLVPVLLSTGADLFRP